MHWSDIAQTLPLEIEKLILRPDVATHVARTFSSSVSPTIERHVKEAITKTLIPAYSQQSVNLHQELHQEMRAELLNIKKDIISWQSETVNRQDVRLPFVHLRVCDSL